MRSSRSDRSVAVVCSARAKADVSNLRARSWPSERWPADDGSHGMAVTRRANARDLPSGVGPAFTYHDQPQAGVGWMAPAVLYQDRQVHLRRNHRAQVRADDQSGESRRVRQWSRQAAGPEPACIDHHVDADVPQGVEGVDEIRPDPSEDGGTTGTVEAGQESPLMITGGDQRQGLVEDHLGERSAVPVGLRDPQQPLAVRALSGQEAGQHGLVGAWITVGEYHRPRPDECQSDGEGCDSGSTGDRSENDDGHDHVTDQRRGPGIRDLEPPAAPAPELGRCRRQH